MNVPVLQKCLVVLVSDICIIVKENKIGAYEKGDFEMEV